MIGLELEKRENHENREYLDNLDTGDGYAVGIRGGGGGRRWGLDGGRRL